MRILLLDSDDGTVCCRIHGTKQKQLLPSFSPAGRFENVTRSYARLKNLIAVRGNVSSDAYMVGPGDYIQNLENPHEHVYTFDTTSRRFSEFYLSDKKTTRSIPLNHKSPPKTRVPCKWVSGESDIIDTNVSLFPGAGILHVPVPSIRLPRFNARHYNLEEYNATLVKNNQPFQITRKELGASDEYRVVTYEYGTKYAVEHPENTFLEQHTFAQTMSPLSPQCGGFVTLGKRRHDNILDLIAVRIPFGYTLIVHPYAIHGDATLTGPFAMAMTSNHHTMQTADTVLVRYNGVPVQMYVHKLVNPRFKRDIVCTSKSIIDADFSTYGLTHSVILSPSRAILDILIQKATAKSKIISWLYGNSTS